MTWHLSPPLAITATAAALRMALPDFDVTVTPRPYGWAFEVTRVCGTGNPVCLISRDPGEICQALTGTRHP